MRTSRTVSDLENAIEEIGRGTGIGFSNLFSDFLEIALCLLCNNPTDTQKKALQKTFSDEKKKALFFNALEIYGDAAEGYSDPLGNIFMERISHGHNGQFFTPDNVCKMMAQILHTDGATINDPCCGSGRTLLAGLEEARKNGKEPTIYANDLSYTASQMCLMNLLYNSAKGMVSCGDSLRLDFSTFIFFQIDRVMMPDGRWISTYWQYTDNNFSDFKTDREKWIKEMADNGLFVEL